MRIARVDGRSLAPRLPEGSFAVFRRRREVKRGDIVAARHPQLGIIVRRVATITLRGRISLHAMPRQGSDGEGASAGSSAGSSAVARDQILGTLMFKLPLLRWRTGAGDAADAGELQGQ